MPGMRCTVGVCNNSKLSAKKSGKDICFYRFPKNKNLRKMWVQKCNRGGKWDPENCRVCSDHFTEEDYERDLQAELLNLPDKRKLKATAVPSLNLVMKPPPISTSKDKQRSRLAKRNNKLLVKDILKSDVNDHPDLSHIVPLVTVLPSPTPCNSQTQEENVDQSLLDKYESLLAENEVVKKQLMNKKEENDNLQLKINSLENDLAGLSSKLKMEESYRIQLEKSLKRFLSKNKHLDSIYTKVF